MLEQHVIPAFEQHEARTGDRGGYVPSGLAGYYGPSSHACSTSVGTLMLPSKSVTFIA
ncbi:MAG TPA: hypothetical protein VLB75_01395 [Steroidobacteraceae bacterium]|nr:hypothetical protein [Steroidobacteraceae bacterium]